MRKNSVIKVLAWLMILGAAVGALIVFLKKYEEGNDDLFDDNIEEFDSCPGCSDTERSYTTISKEPKADEGQETVQETAEEADKDESEE